MSTTEFLLISSSSVDCFSPCEIGRNYSSSLFDTSPRILLCQQEENNANDGGRSSLSSTSSGCSSFTYNEVEDNEMAITTPQPREFLNGDEVSTASNENINCFTRSKPSLMQQSQRMEDSLQSADFEERIFKWIAINVPAMGKPEDKQIAFFEAKRNGIARRVSLQNFSTNSLIF